jgi:4-carboxymuconolactone decarboxylase
VNEREHRLLKLFAACVLGRWENVRALRRAAPPGEPDRLWREAVLQVHVFAGFPRQVEAYDLLLGLGGLGPTAPEETDAEDERAAAARGRELFERIYREQSQRVGAFLADGHPSFERWTIEHAYGRVLARGGLEPRLRELLAVAALAVLGQEKQLASHVRGAVRCGAAPAEPGEVLVLLGDWIPAAFRDRAAWIAAKYAASPEI